MTKKDLIEMSQFAVRADLDKDTMDKLIAHIMRCTPNFSRELWDKAIDICKEHMSG